MEAVITLLAPPTGRDGRAMEAEQTRVKSMEAVPASLGMSVTGTYTLILFNEDNYYS